MRHRIPEAVLPSHGAGIGPFAPRGAPKTPAPAVVYLACFGCAVFLVLCVVSEHGARDTELDVRGAGGGRRLTQWLAPVWYSLPTLFDSLYNLVRPRAPSSPLARPRALTVSLLDVFVSLVPQPLFLLDVRGKTRQQGEAWADFQLLPEEYRLAAEANARAAMLRATAGTDAEAFAPEPAPENAAVADAEPKRDREAAAYEPFPEYADAVRMMRR